VSDGVLDDDKNLGHGKKYKRYSVKSIGRREVLLSTLIGGAGLFSVLNFLRRGRFSPVSSSDFANSTPRDLLGYKYSGDDGTVVPLDEESKKVYTNIRTAIYSGNDQSDKYTVLVGYDNDEQRVGTVHRPIYCYEGAGFKIAKLEKKDSLFPSFPEISGTYMIAEREDRREAVIYVIRLSSFFPTSEVDQNIAELKSRVMYHSYDAALLRMSTSMGRGEDPYERLREFGEKYLRGLNARGRDIVVGLKSYS